MQAPPKQVCTRSTLQTAEEVHQQVASQLWNPALASMCLLVQSAALAPAGFSSVRQREGCTVHSPPPWSPNHAATWCPRRQSSISLEDQHSHGHSITLRFLRFPSICSHSWRRTFVETFCMRTSHADVACDVGSYASCTCRFIVKRRWKVVVKHRVTWTNVQEECSDN